MFPKKTPLPIFLTRLTGTWTTSAGAYVKISFDQVCIDIAGWWKKNGDDIKQNIMIGKLSFPSTILVSKEGKKLIKLLLKTNPKHRLGSEHGATDIKEHPFFNEKINWGLLRNMTPPIIPKIS